MKPTGMGAGVGVGLGLYTHGTTLLLEGPTDCQRIFLDVRKVVGVRDMFEWLERSQRCKVMLVNGQELEVLGDAEEVWLAILEVHRDRHSLQFHANGDEAPVGRPTTLEERKRRATDRGTR